MDKRRYDEIVEVLENELVPALGCTEPIAVAYAAAKAREVLGKLPTSMVAECSGNIIKNVMGVIIHKYISHTSSLLKINFYCAPVL